MGGDKNGKIKYMIFRCYPKGDRDESHRYVFYGWTFASSIVKIFFKQRKKSKYKVIRMTDEDIARKFHEDVVDSETMIDSIELRSATTGDKVKLFSTSKELCNTEIMIQRHFSDLSSFENASGDGHFVEMLLSLKKYYRDALDYIGYRPRDIDALYPSADEADNYDDTYGVEENIFTAYENRYVFQQHPDLRLEGKSTFDDDFRSVIYSLENFIKVMKNDM